MHIVQAIHDWAVGFFGVNEVLRIIKTGDYASLKTYKGITSVIYPLFPIITVFEFFVACIYKKFKIIEYKIPFFSYLINAVIGRFISIAAVAFIIGTVSPYAVFKTHFTWYWFIYGYIIWAVLVFAQYASCPGADESGRILRTFFSGSAICRCHPDGHLYFAGC
jgi:hypothetical protein